MFTITSRNNFSHIGAQIKALQVGITKLLDQNFGNYREPLIEPYIPIILDLAKPGHIGTQIKSSTCRDYESS